MLRKPLLKASKLPSKAIWRRSIVPNSSLSFCQIQSPISGRAGNLLVNAGNLVKVNDVPLVVIHQVSPVFVNFSVPEDHLSAIRQRSARQKLAVRVSPHDNPDREVTGYLTCR